MISKNHMKQGFSLIEVCLAVLVVGLGLLGIFGLFPSGLRAMEEGTADTRCGLFGETVMSGLRANSAGITSWDDWTNSATFASLVVDGVLSNATLIGDGAVHEVRFPSDGDWLRYSLQLDASQHSASLSVSDGQWGPFYPSMIYTEFYFQGM